MRRRAFKADDLSSERVTLRGDEAHHALHVLRLSVGDEITLFDGRGLRATARITNVTGESLVAEVLHRAAEKSNRVIIIATAIPKGERADWLVEKCAELGVSELIPLLCERGQVSPGAGKLARWRRKADEAAKQSGQSRSMSIREPMPLLAALEACAGGGLAWYGAPGATRTLAHVMGEMVARDAASSSASIWIGPEGGFSPSEVALLERSGAQGVSLGGTILRVETAAIAAAAVWGVMNCE